MTQMTASKTVLTMKYARVIAELAQMAGVSLEQALDLFYRSHTYQEMRTGIGQMHCRSEGYLAEEITLENIANEANQ